MTSRANVAVKKQPRKSNENCSFTCIFLHFFSFFFDKWTIFSVFFFLSTLDAYTYYCLTLNRYLIVQNCLLMNFDKYLTPLHIDSQNYDNQSKHYFIRNILVFFFNIVIHSDDFPRHYQVYMYVYNCFSYGALTYNFVVRVFINFYLGPWHKKSK